MRAFQPLTPTHEGAMAKRIGLDELLERAAVQHLDTPDTFGERFQTWVASLDTREVWSLCQRVRELSSSARLWRAKHDARRNRAQDASRMRDERERELRATLQAVCPHDKWTGYHRVGNASFIETACLVCGVARSRIESGARVGD